MATLRGMGKEQERTGEEDGMEVEDSSLKEIKSRVFLISKHDPPQPSKPQVPRSKLDSPKGSEDEAQPGSSRSEESSKSRKKDSGIPPRSPPRSPSNLKQAKEREEASASSRPTAQRPSSVERFLHAHLELTKSDRKEVSSAPDLFKVDSRRSTSSLVGLSEGSKRSEPQRRSMDGNLLKGQPSSANSAKHPDEELSDKEKHLSIIKKWTSVFKADDRRESDKRAKPHTAMVRVSPRPEQHEIMERRQQTSPRSEAYESMLAADISIGHPMSESERSLDINTHPVGLSMTGNPLTSDGQSMREVEELQQLNVQLMSRLFQLQNDHEQVRSSSVASGSHKPAEVCIAGR
eukprot:766423-Hanusia_phi.AAC.3